MRHGLAPVFPRPASGERDRVGGCLWRLAALGDLPRVLPADGPERVVIAARGRIYGPFLLVTI